MPMKYNQSKSMSTFYKFEVLMRLTPWCQRRKKSEEVKKDRTGAEEELQVEISCLELLQVVPSNKFINF